MDARLYRGSFQFGYKTEAFGTAIVQLVPGKIGCKARVTRLIYRAGTTAHDLFVMRPCQDAAVASTLAATGTALILNTEFKNAAGDEVHTPASGDYIAVPLDNGQWHLTTISAWNSGTLTLTLNTAVPSGRSINAGARCYFFGVASDAWHLKFEGTASAVNDFNDPTSGLAESGLPDRVYDSDVYANRSGFDDPLLFYSANGTAAGFLRQLSGYYSKG